MSEYSLLNCPRATGGPKLDARTDQHPIALQYRIPKSLGKGNLPKKLPLVQAVGLVDNNSASIHIKLTMVKFESIAC
jgi:hypothetical protein